MAHHNPGDKTEGGNYQETSLSAPRVPRALQGTVLGMYLETRQRKYLLSFFLFLLAYALFADMMIHAIWWFGAGSILGDNNQEFFKDLFRRTCWVAGFISLASFAAGRRLIGFKCALVAAALIVVNLMR